MRLTFNHVWHRYWFLGGLVVSNLPIRCLISTDSDLSPSRRIFFGAGSGAAPGREHACSTMHPSGMDDVPAKRFYDDDRAYHMEYSGRGRFSLDKKSGDILVSLDDAGDADAFVSAYMIPMMLVLAAETAGNPCLHASGVVMGDGGILFAGEKGAGKSSLCSALIGCGYSPVADDIAPIAQKNGEFRVLCSESRLKLWPDSAQALFGSDAFPIVLAGTQKRLIDFTPRLNRTGVPSSSLLRGIVFIQRDKSTGERNDVTIVPMKQRDALLELYKHFHAPLLPTRLGLHHARLAFFAELVRHIPIVRLTYPSGYERLPEVIDAIEQTALL